MPVFFFDWVTTEGRRFVDELGVRCADLGAARAEAVRALAEAVKDGRDETVIEIRDAPGAPPRWRLRLTLESREI